MCATRRGIILSRLTILIYGVALCILVTAAATLIEIVEVHYVGEPYLEALVLAIVLGVGIRTLWEPGQKFLPGIGFSAKTLLEVAVVLLGASISAQTVKALGASMLVGIAAIVFVAVFASYAISRAFGLPKRMSILIACGNSICGNSAIAAVAPVIGADGDDIASSIAFTAVLGVIVVLLLPFLVPLLSLSLTQYGVLAGLTVYAVPQVLAATLPIGALSNQVGTVVKLVRVLMLGPVVLGLSLVAGRLRDEPDHQRTAQRVVSPKESKLALHQLVPWFILGFLFMAAMRSISVIPEQLLFPIARTANVLTTVSMAALGLGVDVRVVARAGLKVTAAVTASLLVLGVISLALIVLLGVA